MLCPDCENFRFPSTSTGLRTSAYAKATSSSPAATEGCALRSISTKMHNKTAAKTKVGKKDDKKSPSEVSVGEAAGDEPHYSCFVCRSTITGREYVKCDICEGRFHLDCSGIPVSVQQSFLQIAESVGWTCCPCRSTARMTIQKLQAGLTELTETVAKLKKDLSELKNTSKFDDVTGDDTEVPASQACDGSVHIRTVVHKALQDINRRKSNVVVTGLPEDDNVDDTEQFVDLCENNLSCKPLVLKTVRLGKRSVDKTRKLLVRLRDDSAAMEVLKVAHQLRKSTDQNIARQVYINEDLSPEAAKLAYEARQRRRQQRALSAGNVGQQEQHNEMNPVAKSFSSKDSDRHLQ